MPPLTLWKGAGIKSKDFEFFDRHVSEQYRIGGTEFWIHKYLGPADSSSNGDATMVNTATDTAPPELQIQDMLNMEVRDRKYDPDVYSLKGHYPLSDTEFDLRQFGLFISNDTVFITFHQNDMVNQIGRRLMSGDVIEVLHQRDDLVLGSDAINKFYVVDEGSRPAEGYSPTWWPHIWRVKCQPITDSQEYQSILGMPATDSNGDPIQPNTDGSGNVTTLSDLLSTYNQELAITNALQTQAQVEVPFRNLQGQHFYVLAGDINKIATIWNGDGIPPNQSKPVNSGTAYPDSPTVGDYFLRTDYSPPQLFVYDSGIKNYGIWRRVEVDYRAPWLPTNRVLSSFINNTNQTTLDDNSVIPEQIDIKKSVAPKLDPDII